MQRFAMVIKPPATGKREIISPRDIYGLSQQSFNSSRTKTAYGTDPMSKYESNREMGPLKYRTFVVPKNKPVAMAEPLRLIWKSGTSYPAPSSGYGEREIVDHVLQKSTARQVVEVPDLPLPLHLNLWRL